VASIVKLDRWNLRAGTRLWEQIADHITNPAQCDAWLLYATQTSLGSEPCREEFAYALNRALSERGQTFPIVGIFPATVDQSLIPPGIRARLYVSLTDPDWKERVKAAVERRDPNITLRHLDPFEIKIHSFNPPQLDRKLAVEMRPRAGTWTPFIVLFPLGEKNQRQPETNARTTRNAARQRDAFTVWRAAASRTATLGVVRRK